LIGAECLGTADIFSLHPWWHDEVGTLLDAVEVEVRVAAAVGLRQLNLDAGAQRRVAPIWGAGA
jgi:hypothetical protein